MTDQEVYLGIKEEAEAVKGVERSGSTGNLEGIWKRKREKVEEEKKVGEEKE